MMNDRHGYKSYEFMERYIQKHAQHDFNARIVANIGISDQHQLHPRWLLFQTSQILMKKLFSPSLGSTHALLTIGSAQLILMRSGVAGLCKCNTLVSPNCARAALSASRIAKNTQLPMKRGGSPVSALARFSLLGGMCRLTNTSTPLNRPQILPLHVFQKANVHDLWHVSESGDLVVARPLRR
jgi:hypothetical protein